MSARDEFDGLDQRHVEAVLRPSMVTFEPLGAQHAADKEAGVWAEEWGCHSQTHDVVWPNDLGPPPPIMGLQHLKRALLRFPAATWLGWDQIHPRALLRLDDSLLLALLRLLFLCECQGKWPLAVALVVIVLLPKPDGGRRPIGLLPSLPRIWMRIRRTVAEEWESLNKRSYLYAGAGKGAPIATWKQAARAEVASSIDGAQCGLALLDLVKAFERVQWHILVREAFRLRYPLWILRLSIAAYRMGRTVRVDSIFSFIVFAVRGITAGSGLATTELRVLMINIVDSACVLYPAVIPVLYVDDLSVEVAGTRRLVITYLIPFELCVCKRMREDLLEVSRKKSVVTSSTDWLGFELQRGLAEFGVCYSRRVKSFGAGLGAGSRRNTNVASDCLRAF